MLLLCLKTLMVPHCPKIFLIHSENIYWATTVGQALYWTQGNKNAMVPICIPDALVTVEDWTSPRCILHV